MLVCPCGGALRMSLRGWVTVSQAVHVISRMRARQGDNGALEMCEDAHGDTREQMEPVIHRNDWCTRSPSVSVTVSPGAGCLHVQ